MSTLPKSTATKLHLTLPTKARGMTLIELMIGVFIGMLTVLAVAATIITFEEQRRGTSTGNDAQVSSTHAAYVIERDLRRAGYGLFSAESGTSRGISSLCPKGVVAYNEARGNTQYTYAPSAFAPISINPTNIPAGDANTDVLLINYSASESGNTCRRVFSGATGAQLKVTDRNCFQTGDLSVLIPLTLTDKTTPSCTDAESMTLAALYQYIDTSNYCSVIEITGLPADSTCNGGGGGGGTSEVIHNSGKYDNSYNNCSKVSASWNKAGGLDNPDTGSKLSYTCGLIIGLGQQSVSMAYAVRGGKLTQCNMATADCTAGGKTGDTSVWEVVADDIVSLQAEMGLAANATATTVSTWQKADPCDAGTCTANQLNWARLKLARIAIVARSPQYQKTEITTSLPQWKSGNDISLSASDWKHYRYSTTEATVPIRNVIWGSTQ